MKIPRAVSEQGVLFDGCQRMIPNHPVVIVSKIGEQNMLSAFSKVSPGKKLLERAPPPNVSSHFYVSSGGALFRGYIGGIAVFTAQEDCAWWQAPLMASPSSNPDLRVALHRASGLPFEDGEALPATGLPPGLSVIGVWAGLHLVCCPVGPSKLVQPFALDCHRWG